MNINIMLPPSALICLERLENTGFEAYVVGGFVRDYLIGNHAFDIDITTNALPHQIIICFSDYKTIQTNSKHGTVTIIIDGQSIEVTTYRVDGDYLDNRHPNKVSFTASLNEDLLRRDFTINALCYSPKRGFVDMFGGINDLNRKVISVIGDGNKRFNEDALRIIRAFRFSAQLGFNIDEKTQAAIKSTVSLLKNISKERITAEFTKILCCNSPISTLDSMQRLSALQLILPDARLIDTYGQTVKLQAVKLPAAKLPIKSILALRLASLIDDISQLNAMRFDNETIDTVETLLAHRNIVLHNSSDIKHLLNKIGVPRLELILEFNRVNPEIFTEFNRIISNNECYRIDQLDINGSDLINLGLYGKDIGYVLNLLLASVIQNNDLNVHNTLMHIAKTYKTYT